MRICVIASGSSGNCTYLEAAGSGLLLDAGLSGRETARRLALIGAAPERICGICVSHEHSDHTAGLGVLHRRYGLPLYANAGTIEGLGRDPKLQALAWRVFENGSPFALGPFRIEPFSVPHDAYDPVGFLVQAEGVQVGVVTDIGVATSLVRERLRGCHALVLEANHDEQLLQDAERPWHLKQRIRGRQGHLSNEHAAEMVAEIADERLCQVFLAHLSEDCNRPELALQTARERLARAGKGHIRVSLTFAAEISEVWTG